MSDLHGFTAPGFEPMAEAFAQSFTEGEELGAAFAAVLEGSVVVHLWGGHADRARTRAWAEDTIVPVYSTTKPIAALVVARLVGQGALDFEAPVASVWPEFAVHGKQRLTLAEMLSHQAGLPGFAEPIDPALWFDPPALAASLAGLEPMWPPGTACGYHPLTWGYLAGEVVRRATGRTLGTILREEICGPLGIDFQIGTPAADHARAAEIQKPKAASAMSVMNAYRRAAFFTPWAAPDRGGAIWRETEIPSANGHGGALAAARLYGAFANGGRIEGREIVAPQAFEGLTRRRRLGEDLVLPFTVDWAAGVKRNHALVYGPNPGAFGHSGWGGSMGLGDPARRLSASYVMNRQSTHLQGDPRAQRLIQALYGCV